MRYAVFLLCAAVIAPALASDAPTAPANPDESVDRTLVCPYCETARGPDEFCARCGRLATATTAPSSRFWGDAPYVLGFPAVGMTPSITAEIGTGGIVRETASLTSGDRYTWMLRKQDAAVEGRVSYGKAAKETTLRATIQDRFEGDRLVAREVLGKISGSPDVYLSRKLEYVWDANGFLEAVRFATSIFGDASDREKKPGAWLKHAIGEIVPVRENGRIVGLRTTVREGKRSLRGEPEYAEPRLLVETVRRAPSGAIDRVVPGNP